MMWRGIVLISVTAIVIAIVYWRSIDDQRSPSAAAMADVIVPSLSAVAIEGETLFNASCAVCHGPAAAGQYGIAPPLVHIIYEPNHHADAAFF